MARVTGYWWGSGKTHISLFLVSSLKDQQVTRAILPVWMRGVGEAKMNHTSTFEVSGVATCFISAHIPLVKENQMAMSKISGAVKYIPQAVKF